MARNGWHYRLIEEIFIAMSVSSIPKNTSTAYLIAVIVMVLIGVVSVMAVVIIRPNSDNTLLITTIVGFIAPTLMALLAFLKAQETRIAVDGRMDELLELTRESGNAQGRLAEKLENIERMKKL